MESVWTDQDGAIQCLNFKTELLEDMIYCLCQILQPIVITLFSDFLDGYEA